VIDSSTMDNIIFRHYEYTKRPFDVSPDSDAANDVSRAGQMQGDWWRPYIGLQSQWKFIPDYSSKAQKFEDYVILLAEDQKKNKYICGVINAGIKTVFLRQKPVKVALLFGLRVAESHQRKRVGYHLCQRLEKECQKRNVDALYISVNRSNAKAIRFFERQSFVYFSERQCFFFNMTLPVKNLPSSSSIIVHEESDHEKSANMSKHQIGLVDFRPIDLLAIFTKKAVFKTLYTEGKHSGFTLLDRESNGGWKLVRLLWIPASWWNNPLFIRLLSIIMFGSAGTSLMGLWFWVMKQYHKKRYIILILSVIIYGVIVSFLTFLGKRIQRYRVFNRTQGKKSLRIFSIWSSLEESDVAGPALVKRALEEAKLAGVSSILVNLCKESRHVKWFKDCSHGGFNAVFMMKSLTDKTANQESNKPIIAPDCYLDPRDFF